MPNYLFTLTITPVQSFISQAQKIKDLHNGSLIISKLIKSVINKIKNNNGRVVIPKNSESVSNKVVALFENKMKDDIENLAKDLENKINNDFINFIFKETCQYSENLKNFFQVFWVAVDLDTENENGDEETKKKNYIKNYKKLDQSLSAVKNLRKFEQVYDNERKAKCILCGERNQEKDKLCLVCYAKRYCELEYEQYYPSTANIVLNDYSLDGDKAQEKLEKEKDTKKSYTLLKFDIDNLGKKLSSLDSENQEILSEKLGEFSQNVKKFIDNNRGKTIYAGGDDFLGFVNLAYLFDVLDEIYCDFENMGFDEIVENLTFSTSIIIAHYKTPLHKVLDYSRELLEEAKSYFDDKNGVGMMVMSSNAVLAKTICRYDDLTLLEDMRKDKIGMSLHYKLHNIFSYLNSMSFDEFLTQKQMIKVEIKRLLKREEGSFNEVIYQRLITFLDKQKNQHSTNGYEIDFENFIGFLKTLEQLRKVL